MKDQLEKIRSKIKNSAQFAEEHLRGKLNWILPVIFLGLVAYSVYLWYVYAYNPSWSVQKKNDYIRTKERDVIFEKDRFDSVISEIKSRKTNYQKNLPNVPDIFRFR